MMKTFTKPNNINGIKLAQELGIENDDIYVCENNLIINAELPHNYLEIIQAHKG